MITSSTTIPNQPSQPIPRASGGGTTLPGPRSSPCRGAYGGWLPVGCVSHLPDLDRDPDCVAQVCGNYHPAMENLLQRMPKAELHLHLDGSLRPSTSLELARERGLDQGMDEPAMRKRLTAPMPCVDQLQLLEAFALP